MIGNSFDINIIWSPDYKINSIIIKNFDKIIKETLSRLRIRKGILKGRRRKRIASENT
jgi:hypothetical protein